MTDRNPATLLDALVVGAGMAGLTAAAGLTARGDRVVVLEKARGPGGRMSIRRANGWQFDHGAQYFTVADAAFREAVDGWAKQGLVAPWSPRIRIFGATPESCRSAPRERWVGVPGMNAVLAAMARRLDCRFNAPVVSLEPGRDGWKVRLASGELVRGRRLVLTPPPAQCAALLGEDHALTATLQSVSMTPCIALMVVFEKSLGLDFDAAFINSGPLGWAACNGSKPGRPVRSYGESWVFHASPAWSGAHLDSASPALEASMLDAFEDLAGIALPARSWSAVHRWRYARADPGLDAGCLITPDSRLIVAGDWCAGNRVEGAWLSGRSAGEA